MQARNLSLTAVLATAGTLATVAITGVPELTRQARGLLVLDALSAAVTLLAALLVFGRFRRSALLSDLALVAAFFALAMGSAADAFADGSASVTLIAGVLGSVAVLVAAAVPERTVGWGHRRRIAAVVAVLFAPALLLTVVAAVGADIDPGDARTVLLLLTATGFGVGAVVFTRRATREEDLLAAWLGAGCVIAAGSWLLFAMTSAPDPSTIHMGDAGRVLFVAFLLVGAVLEIRSYWLGVGVLEERRRLARELHDGMAQELACIVTEVRRNRSGTPDAITWYRISRAAERALDESRRAIHALISPLDEPLDRAVMATAEDVAAREGAEVAFDLDENVRVGTDVREALVRIVREAVGNAARHGQAEVISVDLKAVDGGLRLCVSDDGQGFAPGTPIATGRVGLQSMRERAAAVGATLDVTSSPGGGTSVEVKLPTKGAAA